MVANSTWVIWYFNFAILNFCLQTRNNSVVCKKRIYKKKLVCDFVETRLVFVSWHLKLHLRPSITLTEYSFKGQINYWTQAKSIKLNLHVKKWMTMFPLKYLSSICHLMLLVSLVSSPLQVSWNYFKNVLKLFSSHVTSNPKSSKS